MIAPPAGQPAASIEEVERVAAWLERPGVRIIDIDGDWAWPLHGTIGAADLPRHALAATESPAESDAPGATGLG